MMRLNLILLGLLAVLFAVYLLVLSFSPPPPREECHLWGQPMRLVCNVEP